MTDCQRRTRDRIELEDPTDPAALERSFGELVNAAARLWHNQRVIGVRPPGSCVLVTDEHQTYPRSILPFRASSSIEHQTVSSRIARTRENPMFAVNYLDREIRKDMAEHHRETVCFARNAAQSVARMWIYLVWHNLEKPYRISPRSQRTHAEVSGVSPVTVQRQRRKFYRKRAFLCRCTKLSEAQRRDWLQLHWTPEREIRRSRRVTPSYAAA